MQKRIVRKLELEMVLSRVEPHPEPKTDIEQYTISVDAAARMLFVAAYADNNILGR